MVKAIPMEDWLRGCIYHDGRHGYVTLPTDKVHQIANYIQRTRRSTTDGLIDLAVVEADRKTEPTISKMEQVDKDINVRSKIEPQLVKESTENGELLFKDEPQTDVEIAKAIVHKAIDESDIADEAYPNLRQRLHDAVDAYEQQTERSE